MKRSQVLNILTNTVTTSYNMFAQEKLSVVGILYWLMCKNSVYIQLLILRAFLKHCFVIIIVGRDHEAAVNG